MNKARGDYSTKIGYAGLKGSPPKNGKWWWGDIWKVKDPLKGMLSMLLSLNNMVLTWELMGKRNKFGPRICILCRNNENTSHIFLDYEFSH